MQIRSLSLKLLTPFNSIKLFQFMVTIETQGAFDCMRNPDLSLKSGFQIWQSNATRISPSSPEKSFLKSLLYGFPLYRSSWKNCSLELRFFFYLLCIRMRDNCSLKYSSNLFSYPRNTDYQRSNFTCIPTTQTSNTIR